MFLFLRPIWFLLLLPFLALHLARPLPTRWLAALRALVILGLVCGLARPALRLPSRHGTLVVLADRSASMPPGASRIEQRLIARITRAMTSSDRLGVVAFGARAVVEQPPQYGNFGGFSGDVGRDRSNLAAALDTGLALIPPRDNGRILLISDGRWTGRSPIAAAVRAGGRGAPVDTWTLRREQVDDTAVARVSAPRQVGLRESFFISVWVQSPLAGAVHYTLTRGETVIAQGEHSVAKGLTRLLFRDRAEGAGILDYTISVRGEGKDPAPENNRARFLVAVRGRRRILVVSRTPGAGLARMLKKGGLAVTLRRPRECRWQLHDLAADSAVIIENIPASDLGKRGMETLAAWVRNMGGGLMMTGGKSAYGQGGYFKSPLDPLLPVSMELRAEHRKLALAIVVALDRSGSMTMPVGGGKRKIDLADMGTAQVLDLLSPMDEFGVIAVDSSAHTIVNLAPVPEVRPRRSEILRIDSMGGGIFIYEALAASAAMAARAQAETRHIILFADAADSEHPADYIPLLNKCRQAGITVSVVGLGTPRDCDAELLRDIARRGKGNCYFTADASELPRLFAQDTFTVARSSFVKGRTPFRWRAGLIGLLGKTLPNPPPLGGYDLCYARPSAVVGAATLDEYKAPVIAAWRAGLGRVLCYTGEADGRNTGPIARWPQVGDMFTGLARWTAGAAGDLPGGMAAEETLDGGELRVRLYLDPDRQSDPFQGAPRLRILRMRSRDAPFSETRDFQWVAPDVLEADTEIQGEKAVLTAVLLEGRKPALLPPVCLPYSPEYAVIDRGRGAKALAEIAAVSGGHERVDPSSIWKDLGRKPRFLDGTPWFFVAALCLFLLEIFQRRTGALNVASRWIRRHSWTPEPVAPGAAGEAAAETRARPGGLAAGLWRKIVRPRAARPRRGGIPEPAGAAVSRTSKSKTAEREAAGTAGKTGEPGGAAESASPKAGAPPETSSVVEAMRAVRKRKRRR